MSSPVDPLEFLAQQDLVASLIEAAGKKQWQVLYASRGDSYDGVGIYCALMDPQAAQRALLSDSWDLMIGNGMPGFSQGRDNAELVTNYHRFGSESGVRPLVLRRDFHGAFEDYSEVDEEFRLYHNLAHDHQRQLLLDFDASGREIEVVKLGPGEVTAQLKYLRQFQAGLGLHLAIFVDSSRYSKLPLQDVPEHTRLRQVQTSDKRYFVSIVNCDWRDGYSSFSRLLGKVLLAPPAKERAGIWPFESVEPEPPVQFIIGIDGEGHEVCSSCNPDELNNYFGANPSAPHYLTPVYFRREVLTKYYSEPHRYTVDDGSIRCLGLWMCRIDNDVSDCVAVYLGDLGRDLPYDERLHWRGFNVAPRAGMSETNFRRSVLAEFTDATAPDLVFRREYAATRQSWYRASGWHFFLDPEKGDAHLLDTVRVPVSVSQPEFDGQLVALTKLLVDSLNEQELKKRAGPFEDGTKGIGKLDKFLELLACPDRDRHVKFLRDLQKLRSVGAAHRRGSSYDEALAPFSAGATETPAVFTKILLQAIEFLRAIQALCRNGGSLANKT
jgi:hypothetical protein